MPVSMLDTETLAPAITAPLGSDTVPTIEPVVVWALRGAREIKRHSPTTRTRKCCMTPSNSVDCTPRCGCFSYKLLPKQNRNPFLGCLNSAMGRKTAGTCENTHISSPLRKHG